MGKYLLIAGVLLNFIQLFISNSVKDFPVWLRFPLIFIAIGMMIAGALLSRR
jgi:hypothetical protein